MSGPPQPNAADTRSAILDIAERLVQSRGYNGFSYADVASELGITKAALHYHFPGKAELGESLILRYTERFLRALTAIDSERTPAPEKLEAYCGIYRAALAEQRMCLCGMLAAEFHTLPGSMRQAVMGFFDENETWLSKVLEAGRFAGTLDFADSAHEAAQMIIAALEGAMLMTRPHHDGAILDAVAARLTVDFTRAPAGRRRTGKGKGASGRSPVSDPR